MIFNILFSIRFDGKFCLSRISINLTRQREYATSPYTRYQDDTFGSLINKLLARDDALEYRTIIFNDRQSNLTGLFPSLSGEKLSLETTGNPKLKACCFPDSSGKCFIAQREAFSGNFQLLQSYSCQENLSLPLPPPLCVPPSRTMCTFVSVDCVHGIQGEVTKRGKSKFDGRTSYGSLQKKKRKELRKKSRVIFKNLFIDVQQYSIIYLLVLPSLDSFSSYMRTCTVQREMSEKKIF